MEQERPVHHRVVPVLAFRGQLVRVERVHALVVAEGALAQRDEVRRQVDGEERAHRYALDAAHLSSERHPPQDVPGRRRVRRADVTGGRRHARPSPRGLHECRPRRRGPGRRCG